MKPEFKRRISRIMGSKFFKVAIVVLCTSTIAFWLSEEKPKTLKDAVAILFSNAEPIAISSAAFVFILEIPDRKKRDHYEAWQVVNSAIGQTGSGGRIQALEDLCADGVDLEGLAAPNADLSGIDLRDGKLNRANLEKTELDKANLKGAYLVEANLEGANLKGAILKGAYLIGANLEGANLEGANLQGANLKGAHLKGANF